MIERSPDMKTAICTLCAAEESLGFYTGCMVKDGHAPEWECDGKGNLTRKHDEFCDDEGCPHYGTDHVCINRTEPR